jgi:hypothetical protein
MWFVVNKAGTSFIATWRVIRRFHMLFATLISLVRG